MKFNPHAVRLVWRDPGDDHEVMTSPVHGGRVKCAVCCEWLTAVELAARVTCCQRCRVKMAIRKVRHDS